MSSRLYPVCAHLHPTKPLPADPSVGRDSAPGQVKVGQECPQSPKSFQWLLSMAATAAPETATPRVQHQAEESQPRDVLPTAGGPLGCLHGKGPIAERDEMALRSVMKGAERDGEVIRVRDTVLAASGPQEEILPYVAKISAVGGPKQNEIFASRHQDENSVACIEDRCYVLPLAQYCRFCALVKRRAEGAPPGSASMVPCRPHFALPPLCVPTDVDPELVYLCRHVYDFRYGRILKNLQ
ncbi:bromo adjacent homology domain-containing 1 protein-like protein [Lates japonicus]|uniref:Bromo adjacent homology domain-containing 1 protein-like protein n=1 Tax=Lates japonicus TaxID=270547 RepID=A0AAD3NKW6_LATJO|nr:bromo adjacent homology domain-containing 1 protein-like protein [Lates japonicus]